MFVNASRVALIERRKIKFWNTQLRRIQQPLVQAPMKMPVPAVPRPKIPTACLRNDISAMMNNKSECDVTFLVENQTVEAHKICLAVASRFFHDLFAIVPHARIPARCKRSHHLCSKFLDSRSDSDKLLDSDSNSTDTECDYSVQNYAAEEFLAKYADGFPKDLTEFPLTIPYNHKAVETIEIHYKPNSSDKNRTMRTVVKMCEDISFKPFKVVVEYLYTGTLRPCGVDLEKIRMTAELLQVSFVIFYD